MSGGIAYVLDRSGEFDSQCNKGTLELERLESDSDVMECRQMIEKHLNYTGSTVAKSVIENWEKELSFFVKVMPIDYKRALLENAAA